MLRFTSLTFCSFLFSILFSWAAFSFENSERMHIQIASSSTSHTFAAAIAETFSRDAKFKIPVAETIGIMDVSALRLLEKNKDLIQLVKIEKATSSFEYVMSGIYKLSLPLFTYFKKENLDLIPGTRKFILKIINKNTIGEDGHLLKKGLISLTNLESKKVRGEVTSRLN